MMDVNFGISWSQNSGEINLKNDFSIPLYGEIPEEVVKLQNEGVGYFHATSFDRNIFGCGSQYFKVSELTSILEALKDVYQYLSEDRGGFFIGSIDESNWADMGGVLIWSLLTENHDSLSADLSRLSTFDYHCESYSSWDSLDEIHQGDGFTNYVEREDFTVACDDNEVVIYKINSH